jgi:hypothetical protein
MKTESEEQTKIDGVGCLFGVLAFSAFATAGVVGFLVIIALIKGLWKLILWL